METFPFFGQAVKPEFTGARSGAVLVFTPDRFRAATSGDEMRSAATAATAPTSGGPRITPAEEADGGSRYEGRVLGLSSQSGDFFQVVYSERVERNRQPYRPQVVGENRVSARNNCLLTSSSARIDWLTS